MTWIELRAACKRQSDYIITLFITNEIALLLTWLLTRTRITPNQVTAASIMAGFGCGAAYAFGYFWFGSLLLFLSHILDCTDGNLARAKSEFSPIGKWLDMAGDRFSEAMIFIGVGFYLIRFEAPNYWLALSLVDAILLSIYYYVVDIGLLLKVTKPTQSIGGMNFKGVKIKWGVLEPVIYGFIILAPIGLINVQLVMILLLMIVGLTYQTVKAYKLVEKPADL